MYGWDDVMSKNISCFESLSEATEAGLDAVLCEREIWSAVPYVGWNLDHKADED